MDASTALKVLSEHLASTGYAFVCPSPETHARVLHRRRSDASSSNAQTAVDFFGWNLPITQEALHAILPGHVRDMLIDTGIVQTSDAYLLRSNVRISNMYMPEGRDFDHVATLYYVHSSFPASPNSVFFGPDTYLFLKFLQDGFHPCSTPRSIIDICCGSGAGAIHMARTYPGAKTIGLDLNPDALRLGKVNAMLANAPVDFIKSDLFGSVPTSLKTRGIDLIVSNPPYIASNASGEDLPVYADGGSQLGLEVSLRIVREGIELLSPGGTIIIYTGVVISAARPVHDSFFEFIGGLPDITIENYTILHPDMWSEEIGSGAYADACRIQVVGAVLTRK